MQRVELLDDPEPWERARREGWEGVIAKRRGSPYEHRRSKHWLKMKCEASQEFVVGGFTDPQGARVGLGALLVGYYDGDDFVFAGKIGTGFDTKLLLDLRTRLDAIEIASIAVHEGDGPAAPARALGPSGDRRAGRRSSSGPCTASCGIRGCSASASTRTPRDVVRESSRDHPSREGAVSRRRDHQGRAGGVLRSHRAGDAAAPARPAGHDGALSRRHRREGLLAEGRLEGISRLAASASRCRRRTASSTIRSSPTCGRCCGSTNQNTITQHVWTSRVPRPRIIRTSACSISIRRPTMSAAVRAAAIGLRDLLEELGAAVVGQDHRLEGLSHRRAARRQDADRRRWRASPTPSGRCS